MSLACWLIAVTLATICVALAEITAGSGGEPVESREFCRNHQVHWLGLPIAVLWLFAAFLYFRSGDTGYAVIDLLIGLLFGVLSVWGLTTPYIRITREEIVVRPTILMRRTVAWTNVEEFNRPSGKKGNLWYLSLRDGGRVKVRINQVPRWDRESLIREIRLRVASCAGAAQAGETSCSPD